MATSLVSLLQLGKSRTRPGENRVSEHLMRLDIRVAILLLVTVSFLDVTHSATVAPAPAPAAAAAHNITIFNQDEADVMNVVLEKWSDLNPQLLTVLNWTSGVHPCNASAVKHFTGQLGTAWRGVDCEPNPFQNATGNYVSFKIISLTVIGSNKTCDPAAAGFYSMDPPVCGFMGVKGELPSELGRLTLLSGLLISDNPELTGPVPDAIWQLPEVRIVYLHNNSLNGPLGGANLSRSSGLQYQIYLSFNKFSGSLQLNSSGNTLFSAPISILDLGNNQLDGSVDFQGLYNGSYTGPESIFLHNNYFNGTFITGPYFNPDKLDLSNNGFTSIKFSNYSDENGNITSSYMPALYELRAYNNKLSGPLLDDILLLPKLTTLDLSWNNLVLEDIVGLTQNTSLEHLDLSGNNLSSLLDFRELSNSSHFQYLNMSNNNFNGTFFTGPYLNPEVLDISNNFFSKISFQIYNGTNNYMPFLQTLSVKNNKLGGEFEVDILKAPMLRKMYADMNQFSGTLQLPEISINDNSSLELISFTYNNYDNIQYPKQLGILSEFNLQVSSLLFLGGNPYCNEINSELQAIICRLNQSSPTLKVSSKTDNKKILIIAISISTTLALIILILSIYIWRLVCRIKNLNDILQEFDNNEVKPNLYSYKEIKRATQNFDKHNKLGEGGFGVVYKGELFDGTIVAVKKLTVSSDQVLSEFLNEVVVISGLKHRNLVKLKGCCLGDGEQRMLVFEYVENNNLAQALFHSGDNIDNVESVFLDWPTRFNIILGIARGMAYLHEDLHTPVIHRDIKAANILLDKDNNPKIADFGLALLFPTLDDKASHLTLMQIAGTRGYCSPEYALRGQISTAADVYSFGIVVLEIVSGRKNIDLQKPEEQIYLREWAWKQFEAQQTASIIDPKMVHNDLDTKTIQRVVSVALTCVHYMASRRPKMYDVLAMLLGNMVVNDNLSKDFENSEVERENRLQSILSYDTTSSFGKKRINSEEFSLLNNSFEIESQR